MKTVIRRKTGAKRGMRPATLYKAMIRELRVVRASLVRVDKVIERTGITMEKLGLNAPEAQVPAKKQKLVAV